MKNELRIYSVAIIFFFLMITSCSKKSAGIDTASVPANDSVTSAVISGNYIITSYTQKTEDKTPQFTGFVFAFAANGKLFVVLNGTTTTGTWSYTPAVTYYGSTSKSAFVINMGNSSPLAKLSKTWNITLINKSSIKIDNPELLEDEHLEFTRQ